jgi:uncharacterized protein with beta-barrel porin domain
MFAHPHRLAIPLLMTATCMSGTLNAQNITSISGKTLITVDSSSPGSILNDVQLSGLGNGQSIIAFDARPSTNGRVLYGLSNTGQLYAINPLTGVTSAVGSAVPINGSAVGFDFNPTVDRIRIVTADGQNLRVDPNTGSVTVDGGLNIMVGGQPITVTGNTAAAYSNNVAGATTTTLYVINSETGLLQIQNPPNDGTLTVVGGLGGEAAGTVAGFDISMNGQNRVSVIQDGATYLYTVNLQTGEATLIGKMSNGELQGLAYTPAAFASDANLTDNQAAVAGRFDNFTSVAPGFIPLLNALDALPDNAARAEAFSQLGPVAYGILPEMLLQTNENVDWTVRSYLQDVRGGRMPASGGDGTGDRGFGGFIIASGRKGDFGAVGDRGEMDYSSTGIMAGLDARLGPGTAVGVLAGYDRGKIELNQISPESRAKTWFFGGYGGFGMGPVSFDVIGSYGKANFDLSRNVTFDAFSSAMVTEADGSYHSLSATAGLNLAMGGLQLEPYVGGRFADVEIDAFDEGEGLTNLSVGGQDVESFQSILGIRLGADYAAGGAVVRPFARAEYRHEFRNGNRGLTSSFNGAGIDAPFETSISSYGEDFVAVGAGVSIGGDAPLNAVIEYNGQMFGDRDIHGLQLGARFRF